MGLLEPVGRVYLDCLARVEDCFCLFAPFESCPLFIYYYIITPFARQTLYAYVSKTNGRGTEQVNGQNWITIARGAHSMVKFNLSRPLQLARVLLVSWRHQ